MKKQKKSASGFWVTLKEATTCFITNRNLGVGERVFFLPQQGIVGEKEGKRMERNWREIKKRIDKSTYDTIIERGED